MTIQHKWIMILIYSKHYTGYEDFWKLRECDSYSKKDHTVIGESKRLQQYYHLIDSKYGRREGSVGTVIATMH